MSDMPRDWDLVTLSEVIGTSGVFCDGDWVETKDQDPEGDVRLIQLADVGVGVFRNRSSRFLTSRKAFELGCTYLEPGDVLVARMPEPLGRACQFPGDRRRCVTVVDVAVIRPDPQVIDPRYLMHVLNAPQSRGAVASYEKGTTRKRISRKNLARISIPLPPLRQQQRIVAAIEEELSRLDAATTALHASRRHLEALRLAVLGRVSVATGDWTTLGDVADIVGGVTKDTKKEQDLSLVEAPYLRVANVQRGYLDLGEVSMIRVPQEKADALCLQPGDILFNEGGDRDKLGRGWVWEGQIDNCIHQNHVFRARLTDGAFDPKFVSIHGNTFGSAWFERMGKQTTNLASINLRTLKAFPVPVLPIEEQERRVVEVELKTAAFGSLALDVNRADTRSRQLRSSILAAAFSGGLV